MTIQAGIMAGGHGPRLDERGTHTAWTARMAGGYENNQESEAGWKVPDEQCTQDRLHQSHKHDGQITIRYDSYVYIIQYQDKPLQICRLDAVRRISRLGDIVRVVVGQNRKGREFFVTEHGRQSKREAWIVHSVPEHQIQRIDDSSQIRCSLRGGYRTNGK